MSQGSEYDIEPHRSNIEGLAYRMLGIWADAQDIAQETFLKWHVQSAEAKTNIREPLAWLHTVASRLSIDRLKSAQRRRETYVGPWLPEPLLATVTTPADSAGIDESITFAFLHAMDQLKPTERAAFLLHDVFDYPFSSIAEILKKEAATCRQLASRARKTLRTNKPTFPVDPLSHQKYLAAFLTAINEGDAATLKTLLAEDAVLYSDGGKLAKAARKPLRSKEIICRFFLGLSRKAKSNGLARQVQFSTVNGLPTALISTNGYVETVFSICLQAGKIETIFQQRNPEKLGTVNFDN